MNHLQKKVSIIGSGISGISCALVLKKLGFEVTVYTKDKLLYGTASPLLVSRYPAASIIPHSVIHENITSIFQHSLPFFDKLFSLQFPGLVVHKHYELFSEEVPLPFYKAEMKKFKTLDQNRLRNAPNHPEITLSTGWEFECFFAEWDRYFPALINRFEKSGGSIILQQIDFEEIEFIESDIIINCGEIHGPKFAGEELNPVLARGHLIHVKNAPLVTDESGRIISYNFTPPLELYKSERGSPQDLYFYPRQDGWILGGSRQMGSLSLDGDWIGEKVETPSIEIDGKVFPEQILSLQKPILQTAFGLDLDAYPHKNINIGYRFMGNKKSGLRLDSEEKFNKLIVHNYGHGGAGVTLSWGCAFEVASILMMNLYGKDLELEEVTSSII